MTRLDRDRPAALAASEKSAAKAKQLSALHDAANDLLAALEDCREALRHAGAIGELMVVDAAIAKAKGVLQ